MKRTRTHSLDLASGTVEVKEYPEGHVAVSLKPKVVTVSVYVSTPTRPSPDVAVCVNGEWMVPA